MYVLKYFQSQWHKLSINKGKMCMENLTDKSKKNRDLLEDGELNKSEVDSSNLIQEDLIARQGSEEQKMKEKYISEVSKIEDAPGDGGIENKEDQKQLIMTADLIIYVFGNCFHPVTSGSLNCFKQLNR